MRVKFIVNCVSEVIYKKSLAYNLFNGSKNNSKKNNQKARKKGVC
jgi:hypothetical protein